MPELVALFNGLGGGASALVAGVAVGTSVVTDQPFSFAIGGPVAVSGIVGSVTFSGSLVAMLKLSGMLRDRRVPLVIRRSLPTVLLLGAAATSWLLLERGESPFFGVLSLVALALGVALVFPIGGADMPVVISFLNAGSGLAAAATGFVLLNHALIVSGALVGASGLILTGIMCRAMNRSLSSVLFGAARDESELEERAEEVKRPVKHVSAEEAAMILEGASRVVIVPGYGMAVAQAQHAVAALAKSMKARGIEITYAVHPVAGRMPGHMNVLLAEADVPYEQLHDLDVANPEMARTDVALVVGANDVVNPTARSDASSPLYGMPIVDVDRARTVIVLKRSLGAGYAGVANPLFYADNTVMLFGDAKQSLLEVTRAFVEDSAGA
jgi:NAD(P) transhydrogenase subunit beta